MASPLTDAHMPGFDRQLSTDSGRDNPFRPDGDISREADEIVQLIKSGRPLQQQAQEDALDGTAPLEASSPAHDKEVAAEPLLPRPDAHQQPQTLHATPANAARTHSPSADGASKGGATSPSAAGGGAASPSKAGANGSAAPENSLPGTVEVTHATVTPTDPAHVEHVVIRKKSKCNCCVIQ